MSDEGRGLFEAFGEAVGGPEPVSSERMERELMQRLERSSEARVTRLRWTVAATALAAAAAFVLLFLTWDRGQTPTPNNPGDASNAAVLMATNDQGQTVQLPHGGVLELSPHTRIRLDADEATGASVELLEGAVLLDVNSGPGLTWQVDSGAYNVLAVGTRYRVERTDEVPQVVVEEGVVRLSGPSLPEEGVLIRAEPDPIAAVVPADSAAQPEPSVEPEPEQPATVDTDAAKPRKSGASEPSWIEKFRASIRNGDDAAAVSVLPASFPNGRERLEPADYVDAGDALRAGGDRTRAEKAYAAACKRAPKSNACGVATVRQAITRAGAGDVDRAIELASEYLDAHPRGALARDALGRRMEWRWQRKQARAARADAEEYLDRWPRGSRAELARSILGQ